MHLFYGVPLREDLFELDEKETHHLSKVLRLKEGEEILVSAGDGSIYRGEISKVSKKNTVVCRAGLFKTSPPRAALILGVGILKTNDRLEWMIEKIVEIGVDKIHLLVTERTERNKLNPERLEKLIVAACKQSLKTRIPRLIGPQKLEDFIKESAFCSDKFIAHCNADNLLPLWGQLKKETPAKDIVSGRAFLIGPEGDFSVAEVARAKSAGYTECGLGSERLRTETAAIAAAVVARQFE